MIMSSENIMGRIEKYELPLFLCVLVLLLNGGVLRFCLIVA